MPARPTITLVALMTLASAPLHAQYASAERGADVLHSQCRQCHRAKRAEEGILELTSPSQRFTPAALTARMWNHGPQTWRQIEERQLAVPRLSETDVRDLFAYFYDRQYFDPTGNAGVGARVFEEKGCKGCHSPTIPDSQRAGPSVVEWPMIRDPVRWSELMWNHASAMIDAAGEAGVRWPKLTVQDMMDLLVYLENLPGPSGERPSLVLTDPEVGERLFRERTCGDCHTLGEKQQGMRDLLAATSKLRTLVEFAVEMWNHAPRMVQRAKRRGLEFPRFKSGEMSYIISLLFVRQSFEVEGDEERGRQIFEERSCGLCHGSQDSDAPPLRNQGERYSTARLAADAWEHSPEMLAAMQRRSIEWPTLTDQDVLDLIAYLNRR